MKTYLRPFLKIEDEAPSGATIGILYFSLTLATASTMGIIIPPSIPMILTGAATSLSIRDLFFGGLVPGILIGLGMLVITTYRAEVSRMT